jgi:hypothetical protein
MVFLQQKQMRITKKEENNIIVLSVLGNQGTRTWKVLTNFINTNISVFIYFFVIST